MKIFLCGDVMTGRGIDQALPHPCSPVLYEGYVQSAVDYLRLAEQANGPVPRPVDFDYVWGAALDEWRRVEPHARIVNLETSITRSDAFEPKGIDYRMSPENAPCLAAAGLDCCVLANNHVLDWGQAGLLDTLNALERLGIKTAGAGRNLAEAKAATIVEIPGRGPFASCSRWRRKQAASPAIGRRMQAGAGVNLYPLCPRPLCAPSSNELAEIRRPRDVLVVSIHWGPNWGYPMPTDQRRFAHALIEEAGVSIVHGHSSHHAKAIEVYEDRLILYGCGDFLSDYEGIAGFEEFRGDLSLMYFADVDAADGRLRALDMAPLKIRRLQLSRSPAGRTSIGCGKRSIAKVAPFATRIGPAPGGRLTVS